MQGGVRRGRILDLVYRLWVCRRRFDGVDTRDDKFLQVAVHGRADLIVTGDADLLALDPFLEIGILAPADYLNRQ